MAIRWTSTLSIGVPEIDRQHEELFRRVDEFQDAVLARDRAGAVRTVEFLRAYVRLHFGAEEELMRSAAYPGRAAHEAEHAAFTAVVEGLAAAIEAEGPTAALVHQVERQLSGWLTEHVYSTDQALGRHLRSRRGAEVR